MKEIIKKIKEAKCTRGYYQIAGALDCETSNFIDKNGEKTAIVYEWTLNIDGYVKIFRTTPQLMAFLWNVKEQAPINAEHKLVLWVHNLSFDSTYLLPYLLSPNVFAVSKRQPVKINTADGFEFRDSAKLTGADLEFIGDNMLTTPIKKLKDIFNYDLVRTPITPLTDDEIRYCENDTAIIIELIKDYMKEYKTVQAIPLTLTGSVRKHIRGFCYPEDRYDCEYGRLMSRLTLDEEVYEIAREATRGGLCCVGKRARRREMENVVSYDGNSWFPSKQVSRKYPMSKFIKVEPSEKYLTTHAVLFRAHFKGLQATNRHAQLLTASSCVYLPEPPKTHVEGKKVIDAEEAIISFNEVDYAFFKTAYKWEEMNILKMYIAKKDYLPREYILGVLDLWQNKQRLKGRPGYELSKKKINSVNGMSLTRIDRNKITWNKDGYDEEKTDLAEALKNENEKKNRFNFYVWGIWTLSYSRETWPIINELGPEFSYSDTDSIKAINSERFYDLVNEFNVIQWEEIKKVSKARNIDIKLFKYGDSFIGKLDKDGDYKRIKVLGEKEYLTENRDGTFTMALAGLSKKVLQNYLIPLAEEDGLDVFDEFNEDMEIPAEKTGLLQHTYIDDRRTGTVKDYLGNVYEYDEPKGVYLEAEPFSLNVVKEMRDVIMADAGLMEEYR